MTISSVQSTLITRLPSTSSVAQSQTGLSSVGSSISSASLSTDADNGFFAFIFAPFLALARHFSNLQTYVASFFPETDNTRATFIQNNLPVLQGDVYEDALDKFSHIQVIRARMEAFASIQSSPNTSAMTVRAFYDLLPVDTQNHLERHIWIENGRNDDGQGLQFGKMVINTDIKSDLVSRALQQCITESA